jgi:thiaminase (transcriptional activator TenA)
MWGFNEIGRRLAEYGLPDNEHYARWVKMYASEEFTALVDWLRELTDRISTNLPSGLPVVSSEKTTIHRICAGHQA